MENTVKVRVEDVRALSGYLEELLESGETSAWHEYEGAREVIERLGLDSVLGLG